MNAIPQLDLTMDEQRMGRGTRPETQEIAYAYLSAGGRVWIIDIGRSYEKICQLLGGQFVEFGEGSRMCLNPFTTMTQEEARKEEADLVGAKDQKDQGDGK